MNYKSASPELQMQLETKFRNPISNMLLISNIVGIIASSWENRFGYCIVNALVEQHLRGGTIVYGSLGFGKAKNIWWEYGNPNALSIEDFYHNPNRSGRFVTTP